MNYLNLLHDLDKTCLIFDGTEIIYRSSKRGVQPLIDFLNINNDVNKNYILADKIIGRGAVILAKLIGVTEIHTPIISKDALSLANKYGMTCTYQELVEYIKNRDNTGRCPIESCVLGITDSLDGYQRIKETLEKLKKATS